MAPPTTDVELSPRDGRGLTALAGRGLSTMTEFADLMGVPLSTATRIVEHLIEKGLAVRSRTEDDRRIVQVSLSQEGKDLNQIFLNQRRKMSHLMLSSLSKEERKIFIRLMAKITHAGPRE
jgi:DNA-binding MarR family transcriptional regulator